MVDEETHLGKLLDEHYQLRQASSAQGDTNRKPEFLRTIKAWNNLG